MFLYTFLLSALTTVLVLPRGAECVYMQGFGPNRATFPLTNNSVYIVPSDYRLNYCPLVVCSSDNEEDVAKWLHPNGSAVATNGMPYYQQIDDGEYPGAGLWRGIGHILTALDEQELICRVTSHTGEKRLHVRVQLPRAPPSKPKLTDAERILAAYGSNLPVMDCIVEKHNAPYPSIAWFKDGVQLHSGPTVTLTPKYTMNHPTFRLSLAITNFSLDARGRYYCVAANGLGEAKSDSVYVDLEGFPAVYPANKTVYFTPGENLTLDVSAVQCKSLHWFYIGTTLGAGGTWYKLNAGEYSLEDFNQTVVARNATTRHEGYYVVHASSSTEADPMCDSVATCTGRVAVLQALATTPSSTTSPSPSPSSSSSSTSPTAPTAATAASNQVQVSNTVIAGATVSGVLVGVLLTAACTACILVVRRRRLNSKAAPAGEAGQTMAVANPYSQRKLPAVRASVLSEDNLYQVVHPKGARSRSRSPLPPSLTPGKVAAGEIPHYAEGFGDTRSATKNLQQEGYMTMGSCGAMLGLPELPVKTNVIDSAAECK